MKKEIYEFVAYIDNSVIARSFLIPLYKKGEQLFFHKLDKGQKHIIGFSLVDKNFKHDDVIFLLKEDIITRSLGDHPVWPFKTPDGVIYGAADDNDFVEKIKILNEEIPEESNIWKTNFELIINQNIKYRTSL